VVAARRHPILTEKEYLERERENEARHEYYRGLAYMMAGATVMHNLIKNSTETRISFQLLDSPCVAMSSDQKVRTESGLFAYPDVIVVCGEIEIYQDDPEVITNPIVLIEVLSKSTRRYDRGFKFEQYKSIPSLREYIMINQDRVHVEHYIRQADDHWNKIEYIDQEAIITLAAIHCTLRVRDIYQRVTF
jgi:Uma2 family endonuclease